MKRILSLILGLLAAQCEASMIPLLAGDTKPSLVYLGNNIDTNSLSTYTFASQPLGVEFSTRKIVVGVTTRINGTLTGTIDSVTVAGVAATQIANRRTASGADSYIANMYIVAVPTGTTGDIVVTTNAAAVNCYVGFYSARNVSSTPFDTATAGATGGTSTVTLDVDTLNGSIVIACGMNLNAGFTWTGVTADNTTVSGVYRLSTASHVTTSAETPRAVNASGFASGGAKAFCAVVLNPP